MYYLGWPGSLSVVVQAVFEFMAILLFKPQGSWIIVIGVNLAKSFVSLGGTPGTLSSSVDGELVCHAIGLTREALSCSFLTINLTLLYHK